jgi:catechol 2,3-dioxygenase-like lactoylglutathione lyase family enzyme
MNPEDRILVAIMNSPRDLAVARDQGWYRLPQKSAPKGIHAEYLAFYFGRAFGEQKWAIHYYARKLGHELVRRRDLLPDEPDHPRADDLYFKVQLGPLLQLERPIVSLRWRRISFIYTTWDRFADASEINDLYVEGEPYVDRLYYALREAGIAPERHYQIQEEGVQYEVDLAIPCRSGTVTVVVGNRPRPASALHFDPKQVTDDPSGCASLVVDRIDRRGGEHSAARNAKGPP